MSRAIRQLVKWFYLLSALLLILLAVAVQSGRSFSHLLGDYNQDIAAYLSRSFNAQVAIGRIDASWDGLKPSLDVQQLSVLNHQEQPILAFERARIRLDILGSLLNQRWVWSSLVLGDVSMDFEQLASGKWQIRGLPPRLAAPLPDAITPPPAQGLDRQQLDSLIDMLLLSERIELQRSQLRFHFTNGQQLALGSPLLLLENAADFHRLSLQMDVEQQPRSVYLVVEGQGDPRQRHKFTSRGYLQLNQFPTSEPLVALRAFLLRGEALELTAGEPLTSDGQVSANLWFASRAAGDGLDVRGDIGLQRLLLPLPGRQLALDNVASQLSGQWHYGGDWQLQLGGLQAQLKERRLADMNLGLSFKAEDQQLQIQLDQLDLAGLSGLLQETGALGAGRLQEVVQTLAPRGQLQRLQFDLPLRQRDDWQLRANFEQLAVNAWRGAPALGGADGYVQLGKRGGRASIDSRRGFSMHYSPSYSAPMVYDQFQGQVAWQLAPELNQIHINSGALRFRQGDEDLTGYMWLFLPWQRNTGDIDLYLQVGGRNLNASLYQKYLPALAPPSLRQWLDDSVGEANPGVASSAGFVYRATLNSKDPRQRHFELYLDLANSRLNYSPSWPALEQLTGRLLVSNGQVRAQVEQARVYDSQVSQASLLMAPRAKGPGSLLQIQGSIAGPATDGMRVLREGILRRHIGSSMDSWFLLGQMKAQLDLAIPLGAGQAPVAEAYQQVDVSLQAPAFELQNLNLTLRNLQGQIGYHSKTGLSSQGLQAQLFGEPVVAELATVQQQGYSQTLVSLSGNVDSRILAGWSRRPELLFLEGAIPYQTRVELNHRPRASGAEPAAATTMAEDPHGEQFAAGAFARVNLRSDLQGVKINLPDNLAKSAARKRPLVFDLWLQEDESQVALSYGEQVNALFRLDRRHNNALRNANLALKRPASFSPSPEFLVSGSLPKFDLADWQQVLARYRSYQEQLGAAEALDATGADGEADPGKVAGLDFRASVTLDRYDIGSVPLRDLAVEARRDWRGWQLALNNPAVAGDIHIPALAQQPMEIKLKRLQLTRKDLGLDTPAPPAEAAAEGLPLKAKKQLDPRSLPLANIAVEQLLLDEDNFGNWSLQLRPNPQGVVIDNIQGSIRGMTIAAPLVAAPAAAAPNLAAKAAAPQAPPPSGAKMIWQQGEQGMQTRFIGHISAGDIAGVMRQWGKPDTLESQRASFDLDIYWAGSPQDFKLVDIYGDMDLHFDEGRFKRDASAGDGILRLLSVLNFDSIARRMRLDFSDLYQSGLAYDRIDGRVNFQGGTLVFSQPLEVRGPSSRLQMAGSIDLRRERIKTRLVATLPVAGNLTFFTALVTGLPAAAGIYVVSKLFKKQMDQVTSISYRITGSWDNPKMRFDRLFESEESLRDKAPKQANPEGALERLPEYPGG